MIFEPTPEWHRFARCKGYPAEIFYGFRAERPQVRERRERMAKELCEQCPAQRACRELGDREPHGIWGGATEAERGFGGQLGGERLPAPSTEARAAA